MKHALNNYFCGLELYRVLQKDPVKLHTYIQHILLFPNHKLQATFASELINFLDDKENNLKK